MEVVKNEDLSQYFAHTDGEEVFIGEKENQTFWPGKETLMSCIIED